MRVGEQACCKGEKIEVARQVRERAFEVSATQYIVRQLVIGGGELVLLGRVKLKEVEELLCSGERWNLASWDDWRSFVSERRRRVHLFPPIPAGLCDLR